MPAKSEAQRRYLAARFGPEWMKAHHFDNEGHLPMYVGDTVQSHVTSPKHKRSQKRSK